ncbi:MAG: response regulator [Candidatus Riflebacteria bacterium]|nr:response regulator [Candidatus Riflebacteria bacterium]
MKALIKNMSISTMLTFSIMVVTFIALASFFSVASYFDSIYYRDTVATQSGMLARLAAEYSVSELIFGYQKEAEENLEKLFLLPDIEEAQIYDANGNLFAERTRPGFIASAPQNIGEITKPLQKLCGARLEIVQPMTFKETRHGTLRLVASTATFQDYFAARLRTMLISLGVVLIFSILLARVIQSWISSPISHIIEKVQEMAGGNLTSRVETQATGGEIASLCHNVNAMAAALEARIRKDQEAAARYEALIGASNTGAWEYHADTGFLWCSPQYFSMLGYDIKDFDQSGSANLDQTWLSLLHPEDRDKANESFNSYMKNPEGMYQQNFRMQHHDGRWIWIWSRGKTLRDSEGKPTLITIGTHIDVTERIMLEDRLRQGEKMEAIGQLAGGVAHDFNNQLSGMLGFSELLAKKLEHEPQLKKMAESIRSAVLHSADLTRQLLAFARKGKFVSRPVDVHHLIAEVISLLQHSIDRRITIRQQLSATAPIAMGDPGQLQSALLNLALNARDAMPDGGELSFSTANVEFREKVRGHDLPPGSYLQINVTDTGTGISEEIKNRLFEPFFTTKQQGKGTGLGLAATYGAIRNHGGAISVYSEINKGTTFRVLLPAGKHGGQTPIQVNQTTGRIPGKGNILLVDDETVVREATARMLEDLGYKVLECRDGEEAVDLFRAVSQDVDAVVLDMVMPRLAGPETFEAMRAINPNVKILLASGFSINGAASRLLKAGAAGFLQKPYQIEELSQKLHEILKS